MEPIDGMPVNLGELIDLLKVRPKDHYIRFDFGNLVPTKCDSYRGYYDDLAIGFDETNYPNPTVDVVLKDLKAAVNKEFTGYKGGEYRMTRKSRVWVANYGHTSDTVITGIEGCDYMVVLKTAWITC